MDNDNRTPRTKRAPRKANPTQLLISGQQIESDIGLPYRSAYDLYLRGILPAVRFPGSRRLWFRRTDIENLIANSVEQHDPERGAQ